MIKAYIDNSPKTYLTKNSVKAILLFDGTHRILIWQDYTGTEKNLCAPDLVQLIKTRVRNNDYMEVGEYASFEEAIVEICILCIPILT